MDFDWEMELVVTKAERLGFALEVLLAFDLVVLLACSTALLMV